MKKVFMTIAMVVAFVATFTIGYINGTKVSKTVVDDGTIIHEYVMYNYGEGYEGVINDIKVDDDNRCEFHVYDATGRFVTSVSVERYTK